MMTTLRDFRSGTAPVKRLCTAPVFLLAQPWILAGGARAVLNDETADRLPSANNDSYNFASDSDLSYGVVLGDGLA
jgi:hypothetical protein